MSSGFQPDTAIITVTYNSAEFIEPFLETLHPLLLEADPAAVVIVVDNASSDETVARAQAFIERTGLQERIILQPQGDNLGFGRGCNAGVAVARGYGVDYYWFLNPDTQVFPNTGRELINFLRENREADFVGSQLVNSQGEPRPSAFRFPSIVSEFCRAVRLGVLDRLLPAGRIALPVATQAYRADWLTGASFMVKREVYDQLEGFDPGFFLYFEEVDLFLRGKKRGYQCWCNPASEVYHFAGASTGISSTRKAAKRRPQYWFESRRYFYVKNYGRIYFALCDLAALAGLSLWRLRVWLQKKDSPDPPGLLRDIAANSVFGFRASR